MPTMIDVPAERSAGVRLHHPSLRSVTYTIENFAVPLKQPMFCWACSGGPEQSPAEQQAARALGQPVTPRAIVHTNKVIHLNIDAVGDVVVAEPIYEMMQRHGLLVDLVATRGVTEPERQFVDTGRADAPFVVSRENGPRS